MCRWQVTSKHAYTLDPLKLERADYAAVQAKCGNLSGNELTHNSSGNTQSQSSQLVEPLLTDPGLECGISLRKLISALKKKKKSKKRACRERTVKHSPQILAHKENATASTTSDVFDWASYVSDGFGGQGYSTAGACTNASLCPIAGGYGGQSDATANTYRR